MVDIMFLHNDDHGGGLQTQSRHKSKNRRIEELKNRQIDESTNRRIDESTNRSWVCLPPTFDFLSTIQTEIKNQEPISKEWALFGQRHYESIIAT
jgi:hypothetical protein